MPRRAPPAICHGQRAGRGASFTDEPNRGSARGRTLPVGRPVPRVLPAPRAEDVLQVADDEYLGNRMPEDDRGGGTRTPRRPAAGPAALASGRGRAPGASPRPARAVAISAARAGRRSCLARAAPTRHGVSGGPGGVGSRPPWALWGGADRLCPPSTSPRRRAQPRSRPLELLGARQESSPLRGPAAIRSLASLRRSGRGRSRGARKGRRTVAPVPSLAAVHPLPLGRRDETVERDGPTADHVAFEGPEERDAQPVNSLRIQFQCNVGPGVPTKPVEPFQGNGHIDQGVCRLASGGARN